MGIPLSSPEPFFGLSVNGLVSIEHLKKNSTACEGDLLYLTKPIGTGMLATALKRGLIDEAGMQEAVDYMSTLNIFGSEAGKLNYVNALTDVTGFGLLGHLIEMCEGANLSAEITYPKIPLMKGVKELAAKFIYADNTMRNWKSYESKVQGISGESLLTLCDPQTSGGLLIAINPLMKKEFEDLAVSKHIQIFEIGSMISEREKKVYIL